MTETIQQLKEDIAILQEKLNKLEEMENHKSPAKEAFKEVYGHYPVIDKNDYYRWDGKVWFAFLKGYEAAQSKDVCPDEIEWNIKEGTAPPEPTPNKFLQRLLDGKIDERGYVDLREPTPTVFRQKLFDGIKSVFYDPDYERTHWKHKVNMAVDEVLRIFRHSSK